jgi:hypothetical protein
MRREPSGVGNKHRKAPTTSVETIHLGRAQQSRDPHVMPPESNWRKKFEEQRERQGESIHEASRRLREDSRSERERLLGDLALKRTPAATARGALDALGWADGGLSDAWRLAESLQTAAAHDRSPVAGSLPPHQNGRDAQRPDRPGPATQAA